MRHDPPSSWCKRDERRLHSTAFVSPHVSVCWKRERKAPNRCSSINIGRVAVCVGRCTKVLIQLFANVWAPFLRCFNLDVMKTNPQRPRPKSQQLFNNIHAQPGWPPLYNAVRSGRLVEWTKEQNPRAAQCNTLQNVASELSRAEPKPFWGRFTLNVKKRLPHAVNFTGVYVADCNPSMRLHY